MKTKLSRLQLILIYAASLILGALTLVGCSSTNLAKVIDAAAKDPAIVTVQATHPYGNVKFTRVGPQAITNGTVTVSSDGTVTIKSP